MGDGKGWPDWVLVHPTGGVLFVEVKRDGVHADAAQLAWGDALRAAGAEWEILNVPSGLRAFWVEMQDRAHREPERLHRPLIAEVMAAAEEHRSRPARPAPRSRRDVSTGIRPNPNPDAISEGGRS